MEITSAYTRRYKMRTLGKDGLNTVVSLPRAVIELQASKRGLSVEEFLKSHRAVALYDNFDGVFYIFEKAKEQPNE